MKDILDIIENRSSAECFDASFHLGKIERDSILESLAKAPKGANLQHFAVRYFEKRDELKVAADLFGGCSFLENCSLALFFFVDLKTTNDWMGLNSVESPFFNALGFQTAYADICLAAQTAILVGESLGLKSRILSHGLQRSKAASEFFSCPIGVVPSLILAVGKDEAIGSQKRFRLKAKDFCIEGLDAWKSAKEIYVDSGKQDHDLKVLMARPEIAAKIAGPASSTAQILSGLKYRKSDMDTFSRNLHEHMADQFSFSK